MIPNPFAGKFIAFEGIDGSGKSAQFTRARNLLMASGVKAIYVKEPTSPEIYDRLYGRHPEKNFKDMTQLERQSYYFQDRIQHYRNTVIPALQSGINVISDRCLASVVLDVERPGDLDRLLIEEAHMFSLANVPFIMPDLVLIFDVRIKIAMERLGKKSRDLDFFEKEDKIKRARRAYLDFFEKFDDSCRIVDGTDSEELVFARYTRNLVSGILAITEWR